MDSEDGQIFVKNLAHFVHTHEKALANALQLRRQGPKGGPSSNRDGEASSTHINGYAGETSKSSTTSSFAAALSLGTLHFSSHNVKPAKLTLTPHHLFYLLTRFEEIGISIGPMNVRLESLHAEVSPANYVSFLSQSQRYKGRSDRDSIHSVSSVRSVVSGMSFLWSNIGLGSSGSAAKSEKAKAQQLADTRYLYSAFTKIPCLRLAPDHKAGLIGGYEEFPFDTAVPLHAFKNLSALEVSDVDFRQFFGWDRLADQLRSLTIKRGKIEDPTDLLVGVVLDDMDRRRRRSSRTQNSPIMAWPSSPLLRYNELARTSSTPNSPTVDDKLSHSTSPRKVILQHDDADNAEMRQEPRPKSTSPSRPTSSRQDTQRHVRGSGTKIKRSGSGSSNSSDHATAPYRSGSSSNLLSMGFLPASKWRFLRHLSLADNSLTSMTASSLAPLANTLHSLDLSSNLFAEIPDCLASLTALRALNLSNCMIESLHSLARSPLPAITALNLRSNRLASIAGIQRLPSLERLDLRDNKLKDPTELARLTSIPEMREIWVACNPFTRTHGGYRVTIFNLFRGTPGYTEDVYLDSQGPGYGERRQLRDRVAESEAVPVMKPLPPDPEVLDSPRMEGPGFVSTSDHRGASTERVQRPSPHITQSEATVGSNRKRRGPRRRIVDLARDDSCGVPQESSSPQHQTPPPTTIRQELGSVDENGISPRTKPTVGPPTHDQPAVASSTVSKSLSSPSSPVLAPAQTVSDKGHALAHDIQHLNLNGEAYRHKVEALKTEVGSNWLNVLSEEGWNAQEKNDKPLPSYPPPRVMRPELSDLRFQSHGIVGGSRTLG
ncbi:MAG: hypothetical protein Q9191_004648 [Dirinaria sp. TL-2023a]